MSKKARNQRRSLSAIEDATELVRLTRRMADYVHLPADHSALSVRVQRQAGGIAMLSLRVWERDRVVLRCDPEFAAALLDTDRDTEVPATCFERFPFHAAMVSFPPFDIHDGQDLCRYYGVLMVGSTTGQLPASVKAPLSFLKYEEKATPAFTTYGPVADNEAVRFSWFFIFPETGLPGMQTITLPWRGEFAHEEKTVAALVEGIREMYRQQDLGAEDLDLLVPLSVSLLLYLGSADPDIDRPIIIGGDGTGPTRNLTGVSVRNMGFRVGAAIRSFRDRGPSRTVSASLTTTGRRLPPHIRSAHWHRFRVATRGPEGQIVGDRLGEKNVDWHYELRWIAPTPVNVGDDGPQPTVREVS